MKHRRGINLGPAGREEIAYLGYLDASVHATVDYVPEWHALGAHCPKCEREAWVVRWDLSSKWGKGAYLGSLTQRLRCQACGNTEGNMWIIDQLPR